MKTLRISLVLVLAVCMLAGCTNRNNNNSSSSPVVSEPPVTSEPGLMGDLEEGWDDLASDVEEGWDDLTSGMEEGMGNIEDGMESGLDLDRDMSDNDMSLAGDQSAIDDESIAAAMSTDFSEIGALDAEKMGWGSGGPTDDEGRPDGATVYQGKYGKYDALFIAPNRNVYLTFDEGYENGFTPTILDTLKEKDAKAVFFITKDFAQRQPELVKRMIDEGHVLGNHSVKHLSFPDMPLQEAAADIMELHTYIQETFGYEMTLFRPPMGEFSEQSLAVAQSLGYKSVLWSFAYKDYDVDNQPLYIEALDLMASKCHPGAIYLLHAVSQTNSEVLGEAIDKIREQGFTIAKWDI